MSERPQRKPRRTGRYYRAPRVCSFCTDHAITINYKDVNLLRKYIVGEGKIRPRRQTGTCARHQRKLAKAIKQSRHMALMPFANEVIR
ncbi:MAG: 30S ribosomal protein S18 [Chloroflexi bacterium]|nr:30S ribosomal protein S18 [Chloroflexota bacterium]